MSRNPINGVESIVCGGRGFNMTLDAHSFELVQKKTSLSADDFYNHPEKITDACYTETLILAYMLCQAPGALLCACITVWVHFGSILGPFGVQESVFGQESVFTQESTTRQESMFRQECSLDKNSSLDC